MNSPYSPSQVQDPPTGHPPLETWIAYREETLEEAEAGRLKDHLVRCRPCLELVLDLAEFNSIGHGAPTVDELARVATWRRLAPRLEPPWPRRRLAAAAALFAVLGIAGLFFHQHRELRDTRAALAALERPQANAPIFDLHAAGTLRGISEPLQLLEVPEHTAFTLILNLGDPLAQPAYEARLSDSAGEAVTRIPDLVPDAHRTLTLTVPGGVLPPGDYLLEIYPVAADSSAAAEPSDRFGIRLVHPAGGSAP